jgi:anti-anti-sigma factor
LRNDKKMIVNQGEFMSLHIQKEQTGDVAVLQCAGKMVRNSALCLLRDTVTSLLRARVIVLDLSEVSIVGAGGLGTLVSLHKWACANGIQLKLVNPSKLVRDIFERTRLTSVLHISTVDEVAQIFCTSGHGIENVDRAVA